MLRIRKSPKHTLMVIFLAVLVIVGVITIWLQKHPVKQSEQPNTAQTVQKIARITAIRSKVLFTGNSFWGRYTNDAAKKTNNPYQFPFAKLNEFDKSKYNAWVTGLECPTSQKGINMTSAQMEAALQFNCDPAYLEEFAKWFEIVSLANNHTDNMGEDGFAETRQVLEKHGIQHVGHYDANLLDDVCQVVSLPVTVDYDDDSQKNARLPVAICAHHFVFGLPSAESVNQVGKFAAIMPTIAMPHGGQEYKPAPDTIKAALFRSMIDQGADMVIGDHPHWVQTSEAYKDKLIVYSMGNFMFDQQFNQEVVQSVAIAVDIEIEASASGDLDRWIDLGEKCAGYLDDCLKQATYLGLDRIQPKYQFSAIATSNKGYQTRPADELQARVEERLRWSETMKALPR